MRKNRFKNGGWRPKVWEICCRLMHHLLRIWKGKYQRYRSHHGNVKTKEKTNLPKQATFQCDSRSVRCKACTRSHESGILHLVFELLWIKVCGNKIFVIYINKNLQKHFQSLCIFWLTISQFPFLVCGCWYFPTLMFHHLQSKPSNHGIIIQFIWKKQIKWNMLHPSCIALDDI